MKLLKDLSKEQQKEVMKKWEKLRDMVFHERIPIVGVWDEKSEMGVGPIGVDLDNGEITELYVDVIETIVKHNVHKKKVRND